jgi:hypothetical protein
MTECFRSVYITIRQKAALCIIDSAGTEEQHPSSSIESSVLCLSVCPAKFAYQRRSCLTLSLLSCG